MKNTKVITEVLNIINSNMTIAEKENALNNIEFDRRPGCDEARELKWSWQSKIATARNRMRNNLNIDGQSKKTWDTRRTPVAIREIIDKCKLHGFDDFADRLRAAFISNISTDLFKNENEKDNYRFGFSVSLETLYKIKTIVGKQYGRNIAALMPEYYTQILPVIEQREQEYRRRNEEQKDWSRNLHINKYRGVLLDIPNYTTNPLTADKDVNVVLLPYAFVPVEHVEKDWDYYSKAWHNAHGPKITVTSRKVKVYQYGKGLIKTIDLPKWKPGFMVEIVAQMLNLQQPKVEKSLRKFQTSPWVDVKKSVKRNGIQYYNLTLEKYTVAVVAYDESRDLHYHADTREAAQQGLQSKIAKMDEEQHRAALEGKTVLTAEKLHNRLGFCWPGMTEFAEAVGIDLRGEYTLTELRQAVKNPAARAVIVKYRRELETAKIINY